MGRKLVPSRWRIIKLAFDGRWCSGRNMIRDRIPCHLRKVEFAGPQKPILEPVSPGQLFVHARALIGGGLAAYYQDMNESVVRYPSGVD